MFVLGSLLKTVLWVALIGVIGYDLISITTTQVTVRGDAQQAATVGSDTLHDTGDVTKAYAAVVAYARAHGEIVVAQGFKTLVTSHLPRISAYAVSDVTATSSYPLS